MNFNECNPENFTEKLFHPAWIKNKEIPDTWICNASDDYELDDLDPDYFHSTELEAVEAWAGDNDLISSEEELTERYEQMLLECELSTLVKMQGDTVMINEDFSSYADNLTRDNELHLEQYHAYDFQGDISALIQQKANQ